jgi:hypothetical protein
MLKHTNNQTPNHLLNKQRMIVVTNVCNLHCGGCCQLVGHFPKDKLWFISLEELDKNIRLLKKHPAGATKNQPITIFGGEPTLHPKWKELISLLKSHAPNEFWVNTNGRLGHHRYQKEDNLVYWVDLHPENQKFVQTMFAAADAIKLPSDMSYWEKAQKDCPIWKGCSSGIYQNKAYFCENAGPLDWLYYDGKYGWDLDENKHPFKKTKEEIDSQAEQFCKRCGWCVKELVPLQFSKDPTYVSPLNYSDKIKKTKHSLPVLQPMQTSKWKIQQSAETLPSVGIYRMEMPVPANIKQKIQESERDWAGVQRYTLNCDKQTIVMENRHKHDWIIVLESNQIIPTYAFITLMDWMANEKTKPTPRLNVSIPIYEVAINDYDENMQEPPNRAKSVIVGFHRDSQEVYDVGILGRLGHRKETEGAGVTSLWHDKITDVVGGVANLY